MSANTFMTVICIVILVGWFLISVLSQLNVKAVAPLKARDIFSLIPNWSFFAPRPGTSDYHLLFRDSDHAEAWSRWREIPLANRRTLWGAIWNPEKRKTKALSDVVRGLVRLAQDKALKDFSLTLPYLAILNYVSSIRRSTPCVQTQFMILKSEGFFADQDPQFLFMSNAHNVAPLPNCVEQTG
jgi:hypothetical protein